MAAGGWLRRVVIALSITTSLVVMAGLISAGIISTKQVSRAIRVTGIVPPAGALHGILARDQAEWWMASDHRKMVVLFGVTESDDVGNLEFWIDVATKSRLTEPSVQFVGLCVSRSACASLPEAGPSQRLAILESMDPIQTHALITAAEKGLAYVHRGSSFDQLPIGSNKAAFIEAIERTLNGRAPGP